MATTVGSAPLAGAPYIYRTDDRKKKSEVPYNIFGGTPSLTHQVQEPPSPHVEQEDNEARPIPPSVRLPPTEKQQALANSLYELGLVRNPKPTRHKQYRRDEAPGKMKSQNDENSKPTSYGEQTLLRKIRKYNRELHDIAPTSDEIFEEDISIFTKENSRAICYFARFLKEKCSCTRDLGFYQECSSYITKSETNSPKKTRPKAQALLKKYIEESAPKQIHLLPTIQRTVIRNFHLKKDDELLCVLYIARADILRHLRKVYFPGFLKSDCYLSYLKKEVRDKREKFAEEEARDAFEKTSTPRRLSHPVGSNRSKDNVIRPHVLRSASSDHEPTSSLLESLQPNYFMPSQDQTM